MASNSIDHAFEFQEKLGGGETNAHQTLASNIDLIKKKIQKDRVESIQEKIARNVKNIQSHLSSAMLEISRNKSLQTEKNNFQKLSSRMDHPIYKFNGSTTQALEEDDNIYSLDASFVESVKIPYINKLPPYTVWIPLSRNEKMTEDDSSARRKDVFYDHRQGVTIIGNDSNEEFKEGEEAKHNFSEGEDKFLRMVFEEHGLAEEVLSIVSHAIERPTSEILERYKTIEENDQNSRYHEESESHIETFLNKSLSETLDAFDPFLCRKCMIFNCSLHGNSQKIIYPRKKQLMWSGPKDEQKPCSDHCYMVNSMEGQVEEDFSVSNWKLLEKELYLKGIEMFGRNSCFISKNLFLGWKTCKEVARYMQYESMDQNGKSNEISSKPRRHKKKPKHKRLKNSSKSAGVPSRWKLMTNMQYTPCECEGVCGKKCSCVDNEVCCEKYCGCSKLCEKRFGGCYCDKGQCKTRKCPCFAAGRECDPDVCRNCWVSCGDNLLKESSHHGESQCENMIFLLKKKQKVLLARSDVNGWGVFLKNSVNKDEFIGEYTGEILTNEEADERGKVYDKANFSYLFNLNHEYCLDAYRKGNKLKFANHSTNPNCYAKLMFVAGDHRMGIFAKKRIEAGEELFVDYNYDEKHRSIKWFREFLDEANSKKVDPTFSV
ncbi:unnamed protein product [Vicia faba]|uniref:[Histone H3]-lysine(27) N-trimethyltransferase n=1 Tax=Vicia faba TaxID=3906 RepID=A0AAV1AXL6_VICFA|nr:unnamed protein product [Vicia faba]